MTIAFILAITFGLVFNGTSTISAQQLDQRSRSDEAPSLIPPPNDLTIDIFQEDNIILLWTGVEHPGLEGYRVLKGEVVSEFGNNNSLELEEVIELGLEESTFIDEDVEPGGEYVYQVVAFGEGFEEGPSERIGITLQETTIFSGGGELEGSNPTSGNVASAVDVISSTDSNQFWRNLAAINFLLLGVMLLIYMSLRTVLERGQGLNLSVKESERIRDDIKARLQLRLKSDHEHPDITEEAVGRMNLVRRQKAEEWGKAAE
ncbi:MAG: hypothetical protein ACOCXP_04480 [Candidatus Dojkabacteria bacterium]